MRLTQRGLDGWESVESQERIQRPCIFRYHQPCPRPPCSPEPKPLENVTRIRFDEHEPQTHASRCWRVRHVPLGNRFRSRQQREADTFRVMPFGGVVASPRWRENKKGAFNANAPPAIDSTTHHAVGYAFCKILTSRVMRLAVLASATSRS